MIIKEMANSDRPREKALHYGIETLSNSELLALIIRCGTKDESALMLAQRILNVCGGFEQLSMVSLNDLKQIKGIKNAKALELLGCIELAKRLLEQPVNINELVITSSKDIYAYVRPKLVLEKQEKFYVFFLDIRNRIIKEKVLFVGTLDTSIVHPREIFKEAVACSCASIICVHNHPSGNPEPSSEDIELTRKISQLSHMMSIPLLDHIIVGKNDYFSLKANHLF